MTIEFNAKFLAALNEGRIIVYAPVSGGLVLLDADGRDCKDKEAQPTMAEFLELKKHERIEHFDTLGQGHHIFHGRVDFYRKPDGSPPLVAE